MVTRDWSRTTFGDRVRFMMAMNQVGQNELGARAGIKPGPMSRYANRKERLAPSSQTAAKLAQAWDVSLAWLAHGEGAPKDGDGTADGVGEGPYPTRREAIALLRARSDVPRGVIDAMLVHRCAASDPGRAYWLDLAAELIRADRRLGRAIAGEDRVASRE